MARLPTVGGDAGNWGEVLNDYLVQSHAADGLLKTDSVGAPQLKPSSVTSAALAPGAVTSAKIDKLGQAGGVATLDGSGNILTASGQTAVTSTAIDAEIAAKINEPSSATATALNSAFITGQVHLVVSNTAPTETVVNGKPVVWIDVSAQLVDVPTVPTSPTWDNSTGSYTIPSYIGVDYLVGGVVTPAGTYTPATLPATVVVTTQAQPGYILPGVFTWTHSFPDPTANVLLASDTFTGVADGTVVAGRTLDNLNGGTTQLTYQGVGWQVLGETMAAAASNGLTINTAAVNMRVEFDLMATAATAGPMIHVGASTSYGGGYSLYFYSSTTVRIYSETAAGRRDVTPWPTWGGALGHFAIQIYENTLTVEIRGSVYNFDVSALPPKERGSLVKFYIDPAASAWKLDNLAITRLGW